MAGRLVLVVAIVLSVAALSAQQQPTFRAGIRLVETNVVVHDKSGKPVADLKAGDFKIFEDGKEQKIEIFALETDARESNGSTVTPMPAAPPSVFTNRPVARSAGGVTVILFDRLNTSFEDQTSARDQIFKFLAKVQPTDRVALYVLESDTVHVLHDFTTDTSRLLRVLNRYLGTYSTQLAGSDTTVPDFMRTGDPSEDAKTEAFLKDITEAVSSEYLRRRAESTTAALEAIANHLAGIRGRKSLVWVSSGFPLVIDGGPTTGPIVMNKEVSRATRAVNNANVAVYPVDARGLIGAFANPTTVNAPYSGRTPPQVFTTMQTTHPNQDTMRTIAEDTGGRAYFNSNAIGEAVHRAMDDGRVSYVLGYYSTHSEADSKFRKIEVKVTRSGVDVRHRGGYLALPPPVHKDSKARLEALGRVMQSPIEATNIGVVAEIQRENGAPANEGTLVIRLDASALTWEQKKESREGAIDIVIAQSTPKGEYYKIKETTVNLIADPERYRQMMEEGFTLSSKFTQRPDAYRLHVVVSDATSQAVGSLVIPIQ